MIPRYTPETIAVLWSDEAKWNRVLAVELAAADVFAEDGVIPAAVASEMRRRARFDLHKIDEYEAVVKHDVLAFLQSVGDSLGEHKRWMHLGLTSYDVIDTALSMTLVEAGSLINDALNRLRTILHNQAVVHAKTLMPGRTHGSHAEPTTLGWKICGWIAECDRNIARIKHAVEMIAVGKLSGAVGTYPFITPDQERRICKRLGLASETVATQVIPRDRHAEFLGCLALIGGMIERIALEVRLLQHSEVEELSEPFTKGQRGSSAMPHKKNPVTAENLCGLARLLRSYLTAAHENIALWHERDISHSSVERVILPDATSIVYYMMGKIIWMVDNWNVSPERMRSHVAGDRGLMSSGALLTALKIAGIEDEDIYRRVQTHALAAREHSKSLRELVLSDEQIARALGDRLDSLFDDEAVLARTHIPFQRINP